MESNNAHWSIVFSRGFRNSQEHTGSASMGIGDAEMERGMG
jgi:hypothetical protein